jgi:hypothetical protein
MACRHAAGGAVAAPPTNMSSLSLETTTSCSRVRVAPAWDAPAVETRHASMPEASKGLPADPATWDLAEVGTFVAGIVGDDCDDKLVERFRAERVDGAAMLGLNEALLERHFSDVSLGRCGRRRSSRR